LVQLSRIGVSREGRDVQVLTLNDAASGPADEKPAYLIHGNIHAAELSGTHAALYTARQLVLDHRDQRSDLLRHVCFHIIPRLNPDGAGFVVSTSGNTRSRTDRSLRLPNTLYQQDVDGNGLILEMRAIAEFIHGRPNLFAVLGYHTGPTAVLRPPSTGADADIDGGDLAMMQELAELGAAETGFPVVPVIRYHYNRTGQKDINLRGHFHNFGYHHLGLYVFEFELGTQVNSAGTPTLDVFNTRNQPEYEAVLRKVLAWWDQQDPATRAPLFQAWTGFEHPQLGSVEIGGWLLRHLAGPTLAELRRIAEGTYRFTLAHAAYRPRLSVEEVEAERFEGSIWRVRARVANRGQFPTHITARGRSLRRLQPVRLEFAPGPGVERLSREGHRLLGHLGPLTDSRVVKGFLRVPEKATLLCQLTVNGGTAGVVRVSIPRPAAG